MSRLLMVGIENETVAFAELRHLVDDDVGMQHSPVGLKEDLKRE